MKKKTARCFGVLIAAVLMFSMLPVSAHAATGPQVAEGAAAVAAKDIMPLSILPAPAKKITVTWDANGGKIGKKATVKTKVTKGKKIGKLPATPKRANYDFKGWYTKKTGGTKIKTSTKPTKNVKYFARWSPKKGATQTTGTYYSEGVTLTIENKVLTSEDKFLMGADGTKSANHWERVSPVPPHQKHRTIIRDGFIYSMDDIAKTYTKTPLTSSSGGGSTGNYKQINIKNGTGTIAAGTKYAKTLPYVEYQFAESPGAVYRNYMLNGKIYGSATIMSFPGMEMEIDMIFLDEKPSPPASIFELNNAGYTLMT